MRSPKFSMSIEMGFFKPDSSPAGIGVTKICEKASDPVFCNACSAIDRQSQKSTVATQRETQPDGQSAIRTTFASSYHSKVGPYR